MDQVQSWVHGCQTHVSKLGEDTKPKLRTQPHGVQNSIELCAYYRPESARLGERHLGMVFPRPVHCLDSMRRVTRRGCAQFLAFLGSYHGCVRLFAEGKGAPQSAEANWCRKHAVRHEDSHGTEICLADNSRTRNGQCA